VRFLAGVAFAFLCATSVSAAMANYVEAGMLECRGVSQQYVVTSLTNLQCVYRSHTGARHRYIATIRRIGLDIGINQSTVLSWTVYAPTRTPGPGSLRGVYVGGSANATLGVGAGVNALFGGSDSTISLQPVSFQGQTGIGAAGGVSALQLQSVDQLGRRRR
jgi:hypothetical protein